MSINIQGKPLKEWVEEQKKKDGVMIVHRGTQRTKFGTSTYQGAIVTLMDDKAAAEVFYWGLVYGEQGVADGSMPTGMADMDIRRKPKPKLKN